MFLGEVQIISVEVDIFWEGLRLLGRLRYLWGGGGGIRNFPRGWEIFRGGGVIKFLEVEVEKIWMGLEFFGRGREKKYSKRQHFKKFFRDQGGF